MQDSNIMHDWRLVHGQTLWWDTQKYAALYNTYEQAAIMISAYTTSHKRLQAMRFQIQFFYFFYFSAVNPLRVPASISTESSGRVDLSQLAIEKHESPPFLCE